MRKDFKEVPPAKKGSRPLKKLHVFIDTNVLLKFYHYSKDDIDALNRIFSSQNRGLVKIYVTQQVLDEFSRNREAKIADALKLFNETKLPQLPSFMKSYPEYDKILQLSQELRAQMKAINERANNDILEEQLAADLLIDTIVTQGDALEVADDIFSEANRRVALGNPPGKAGSLGDAINWTILLNSVPDGEPLHLISDDGDFFSKREPSLLNPFLADEYYSCKNADLIGYRTLGDFLKKNFANADLTYDEKQEAREKLIAQLANSSNFSETHQIIAEMEKHPAYTLNEVTEILQAVGDNNQVKWVIEDDDVHAFLYRVGMNYYDKIVDKEQRGILDDVMEKHLTDLDNVEN